MKRREIFIELTSLLDVILIMLFILLIQAKTSTAAALDSASLAKVNAERLQQELTRAIGEQETLRAQVAAQAERADGLQRQLWSENIVLDNSLLVTISVDKGGAIRFETEGEGQTNIPYDWANDAYAVNRLRALALNRLRETDREAVFLVFQFDRGRIYRAEYDMIKTVIQEVKQEAKARDIPLSVLELDIHEG